MRCLSTRTTACLALVVGNEHVDLARTEAGSFFVWSGAATSLESLFLPSPAWMSSVLVLMVRRCQSFFFVKSWTLSKVMCGVARPLLFHRAECKGTYPPFTGGFVVGLVVMEYHKSRQSRTSGWVMCQFAELMSYVGHRKAFVDIGKLELAHCQR